MSRNNKFPSHYRDFIQALNSNKVEYLLIGGYAMGAYGHVRGTNDLDIYINPTDQNAQKLIKACIEYGIPSSELKKEMFTVEKMIGIGEPPLRIELIKYLNVEDFSMAFQRALKRKVDDVIINVIDLDDLILLKKAAIRDREQPRDKEDLNFLERLKKKLSKK